MCAALSRSPRVTGQRRDSLEHFRRRWFAPAPTVRQAISRRSIAHITHDSCRSDERAGATDGLPSRAERLSHRSCRPRWRVRQADALAKMAMTDMSKTSQQHEDAFVSAFCDDRWLPRTACCADGILAAQRSRAHGSAAPRRPSSCSRASTSINLQVELGDRDATPPRAPARTHARGLLPCGVRRGVSLDRYRWRCCCPRLTP
jgi:hypothetical protein